MKSAYVVSDLHMFCKRSQWEQHVLKIYDAAEKADLFVFNGDSVDFKWTSLASIPETIEQAITFFDDICKRYPNCQFHVNLGNHDFIAGFIHALEDLAKHTSNFSWHPYYLRVGSTLFLHGDVANRKMSHRQLQRYRASWCHHKKQGAFKNKLWDAAFRAGAHLAISRLAFPPKRTIKRVSSYLYDIGHTRDHGVRSVYFGHTHVPVDGRYYEGVTYHNGGAPMPGINFALLRADI